MKKTTDEFLYYITKKIIEKYKGNILEIGAGIGETTKVFLSISKEYNTKVVVIDPFEKGWEKIPKTYGEPYPFIRFYENIKDYEDYLIIIKKLSQETNLEEIKTYCPITFAFLDGLQFKDSILYDLNLMKNLDCKIICLDDFTRITDISQVPLAVNEFLEKNNDYVILYSENIETRAKVYLIQKKLYENEKNF